MDMDIEKAVQEMQERNQRVAADKAWEISDLRRFIIFILTYIIAAIWLFSINDASPWLKALVPAGGWVLSTLSLPFIKQWWIKRYRRK